MSKVSQKAVLEALRRVPLFSSVAEKDLRGFLAGCRPVAVAPGVELFSPADRADRFYLILGGRVKIFQLSARGDEQILHLYGPGETFGEAAMWADGRYPAYAEPVEGSTLLVVGREALKAAVARNPELAVAMMAGMARKLHEFNRLIERLSLKEVPARLAGVLLQLAAEAGSDTFLLRQTKRELAAQIGTIAETLSRALAKLKGAGLIEVDGRRITLRDARRLRELAES
jgi:CRP-like cAMP-binding protein